MSVVISYLCLFISTLMIIVPFSYDKQSVKVDSILTIALSILLLKGTPYGIAVFGFITLVSHLHLPLFAANIKPSVSTIAALMETDKAEAKGFLQNMGFKWIILACILYPVSLYTYSWIQPVESSAAYSALMIVFLLCLFNKPFRRALKPSVGHTSLDEFLLGLRYPPVKALISWVRSYKAFHNGNKVIQKQRGIKPSWNITSQSKRNHTTLVVLGESARRDYLHAYGFPLANTTFLSKAKGELWLNFTSPAATTIQSVLRLLSLTKNHSPEVTAHFL